ncbi:MAG TPA: protein translocase subunit SecD [Spirochaetota bacterium]|nr:protein translocase subunit SecD [Spirochaetota bacterium]
MSKAFRLMVIVIIIGLSVYSIWDSYNYYFKLSPDVRRIVNEPNYSSYDELSYEEKQQFTTATNLKDDVVQLGLDIKGGIHVVVEADFSNVVAENTNYNTVKDIPDEVKDAMLEQIIIKIEQRINEYGLSETTIRRVGQKRITVEIPGMSSFTDIESLIEQQGQLRFQIVNKELTAEAYNYMTDDLQLTNKEMLAKIKKEGCELTTNVKSGFGIPTEQGMVYGFAVLKTNIEMTGEAIEEAKKTFDSQRAGGYQVSFQLDSEGRARFAKVTAANKGENLAIILDDRLMSAPTIRDVIAGGQGVITGNFSKTKAARLALVLKSGALPVKIAVVSKDVVNATLGDELLKKGLRAMFWGVLAIVIFMLLRYRFSGFLAALALALNGLIILATLIPLGLTLTLPGIAGLLLTMGMAVDANVIIYERIREEIFVARRYIYDAIGVGYQKAFWTIFDANITTLIAAFILANYGSGPIKGFANTLFIGIIVSMFTSLFCTRYIYDELIDKNIIKTYSKLIV